jgi:hypothetical protein
MTLDLNPNEWGRLVKGKPMKSLVLIIMSLVPFGVGGA